MSGRIPLAKADCHANSSSYTIVHKPLPHYKDLERAQDFSLDF